MECQNCGGKTKKKFYKRKLFWIVIIIALLYVGRYFMTDIEPLFNHYDKEIVATISPNDLSHAAWLDRSNDARAKENFNKIKEQYNGKYVRLVDCRIYSVGTDYIEVTDTSDLQVLNIYVAKDQKDKLPHLYKGSVITVTGRVFITGDGFGLIDATIEGKQ